MKSSFTYYSALCIFAMLIFASCKKEENRAITTGGTPGTLSASASTIVLDKAKVNSNDTSVLFSTTNPNYGFSAATTNVLQIDSMGDNWVKPQNINLAAGSNKQGISTGELNSLLLKLNLAPSKAAQIQVRVMNSVSSSIKSIYTNNLTLSVTPFSLASSVYVPGAYQGWSPNVADSLISATSNGNYTGIINFSGSDLNFKITSVKSFNGTNYGSGTAQGTLSTTGGNLLAPTTGGLLVTVDLNSNTIKFLPQWSIIGDATQGGWSTDTDMFLDKKNNVWTITATLVSDGTKAMKFRFKNDWTVNLGGSNGTLSQGGGNITIPQTAASGDSYKITMDPIANTYTLVKQ